MFVTRSEEETIAFGRALARRLPLRAVILLTGKLGAGKTTLAKGIVAGLGAASPEEVSSPTFTLIHEYGDPPRVYHIDLYRLDEERELASLGLEEIFEREAVSLVEWGERFPRQIPAEHVAVLIETAADGARRIGVTGLPPGPNTAR